MTAALADGRGPWSFPSARAKVVAPPKQRSCGVCTAAFIPKTAWAKFCSSTCRAEADNRRDRAIRAARKPTPPRLCKWGCGTTFQPLKANHRGCRAPACEKARIESYRASKRTIVENGMGIAPDLPTHSEWLVDGRAYRIKCVTQHGNTLRVLLHPLPRGRQVTMQAHEFRARAVRTK